MMIPPNKRHLQALAGWAISAKDNCSPEQQLALGDFKHGCSRLSEVIEDISPVKHKTEDRRQKSAQQSSPNVVPIEVQKAAGIEHADGQCVHKFNIKNQCCIYCGITYLKAHGRKPELF